MIDAILTLWDNDDERIALVPEDEPQIDAAVANYLETGRDAILHLTTSDGSAFRMLASSVKSWLVTTAEQRLRAITLEHALDTEVREARQSLGIWDE